MRAQVPPLYNDLDDRDVRNVVIANASMPSTECHVSFIRGALRG
jgi:hypothetical protein